MPYGINPIFGGSNVQPGLEDILNMILRNPTPTPSDTGAPGVNPAPDTSPVPPMVNPPNPENGLPPDISALVQRALGNYKPKEEAAQQYMNLLQQYPQREAPGLGHKILGVLAGLGAGVKPVGITEGQVVGFQGGSPEQIANAQDRAMYSPFYRNLQDWESKIKPYEAAALNEKNYNQNMLGGTTNLIKELISADRAQTYKSKAEADKADKEAKMDLAWYKTQIDWYKAQNYEFAENNKGEAIARDKRTGEIKPILNRDGTPAMGSELAKAKLVGEFAQKRAETMAGAQRSNIITREQAKNWPTYRDPTDENRTLVQSPFTKKLYDINDIPPEAFEPVTGAAPIGSVLGKGVLPIQLHIQGMPHTGPGAVPSGTTTLSAIPGQNPDKSITPKGPLVPIGKESKEDKVAAQTQVMMDGAKMLLPHIDTLKTQLAEMNKRGLIGPISSRLTELASKLGTSGDFDDDEASFKSYARSIDIDPKLNQSTGNASNDFLIGQFLSNLSFMASGAGRVHGGARGGGSIEMVKYMKSVLSAIGTASMIGGRISTLEDYMKGYAAGPKGNEKSKQEDDAIRKRIENALKNTPKVGGK